MADPDDYDDDDTGDDASDEYTPEPPDKYGTNGDADYSAYLYEKSMNERRFRS